MDFNLPSLGMGIEEALEFMAPFHVIQSMTWDNGPGVSVGAVAICSKIGGDLLMSSLSWSDYTLINMRLSDATIHCKETRPLDHVEIYISEVLNYG